MGELTHTAHLMMGSVPEGRGHTSRPAHGYAYFGRRSVKAELQRAHAITPGVHAGGEFSWIEGGRRENAVVTTS